MIRQISQLREKLRRKKLLRIQNLANSSKFMNYDLWIHIWIIILVLEMAWILHSVQSHFIIFQEVGQWNWFEVLHLPLFHNKFSLLNFDILLKFQPIFLPQSYALKVVHQFDQVWPSLHPQIFPLTP